MSAPRVGGSAPDAVPAVKLSPRGSAVVQIEPGRWIEIASGAVDYLDVHAWRNEDVEDWPVYGAPLPSVAPTPPQAPDEPMPGGPRASEPPT